MRFSYAESMIDPSFYLPLAQAVEDAGYDGMVVPDSLCYPRDSDSTYPFSPDHTREFLEDKPFIEPFSLIPAMGVVTSRSYKRPARCGPPGPRAGRRRIG